MRAFLPFTRTAAAIGCVAAAVIATVSASATPTATAARAAGSAPGASHNDVLNAVAAASPSSAWAVGQYLRVLSRPDVWQPLAEHWDGTSWKLARSPDPGGSTANTYLYGVAAVSPTRAWAVGAYRKGDKWHPLIERWTGSSFRQVVCPNPEHPSRHTYFPATALYGVTALSATDAWAVGAFNNGHTQQTLIMHWNGTAWKLVPSPDVGGHTTFNILRGVAAASKSSAWAVGTWGLPASPGGHTLILHWNGRSWRRVTSPSKTAPVLRGVAAQGSRAWAVGWYSPGVAYPLAEYWHGTAWRQAASFPGQDWLLFAVAATPTTAWAVGAIAYQGTLIERWTGTSWKRVLGPRVGGFLYGVSADSASDAWAVGNNGRSLIEHWNGKSWSIVTSPNR